jgi:hypothetical protein
VLEAFTLGGIQHGCDGSGTIRLLLKACDTLGVKGTNDITNSLDGAPHQLRNGLRGQPLGTREDDLGTPDTEGVRGAAVGLQLPTLLIGQGSNKERWFHSPSIPREPPLHTNSCGDALGGEIRPPPWRDTTRNTCPIWKDNLAHNVGTPRQRADPQWTHHIAPARDALCGILSTGRGV